MNLEEIFKQYGNGGAPPTDQTAQHFDQVAEQANPQDLGKGIAAAFRSDATPSFGQSVGSLFGQSNPQQQAGVLNQIVKSLGSGALSGVAGGILGKILGGTEAGAPPTQITPAQASQLSPSDVGALATHARSQDDSIVDKLGGFYAQHPTLVKTIGAAALAVALGHMRS